jgi:hypothetical protein
MTIEATLIGIAILLASPIAGIVLWMGLKK